MEALILVHRLITRVRESQSNFSLINLSHCSVMSAALLPSCSIDSLFGVILQLSAVCAQERWDPKEERDHFYCSNW